MQGVGKTEGATAPPGPAFGVLQSMPCWVFPQSRKNLLRSNTAKPICCSTRLLRAADAVILTARVGLVVVRQRGNADMRPDTGSARDGTMSLPSRAAGVAPGRHHSLIPSVTGLPRACAILPSGACGDGRPDWMLLAFSRDALQSGHRNSLDDATDERADRCPANMRAHPFFCIALHARNGIGEATQCFGSRKLTKCQ